MTVGGEGFVIPACAGTSLRLTILEKSKYQNLSCLPFGAFPLRQAKRSEGEVGSAVEGIKMQKLIAVDIVDRKSHDVGGETKEF